MRPPSRREREHAGGPPGSAAPGSGWAAVVDMAASLVVAHRVEHVDPGGTARRHGGADDTHDDGEDDEQGELAGRQGEPEAEAAQRRRGERREQDAHRGPQQRADDRGDHALVAHDAPHLALGGADGAEQAELPRALVDGQDRLLAIPNSEMTRLMASNA